MFTLSLERVDAESLTFYQHNDLTEVHRLSRRVSELVFQRHEADTNSLQQLGLMQQVMQDAQQALSESVAERAEDAKKRDAAEAELCNLTASHDELSRRLSASSAALAASEAAARMIEQERDSISARLSESQQQLNDARQQMADAAAGSDALHAELRGQIEQLHHELEASEACTEQHRRRCASLEDSLGQLQHEIKGVQQALAGAAAERSKVSAQRDVLDAELCTLTASHDELSRRLSASSAALAASEAAARMIEQERDSISARLSESQQQLNDARQQMADAAALHAELRVQVEKFTKQVTASEACTEQHRRRCASLEDSIGRLQQEMKTSQQALADCVTDRANDAKRRDALEAEVADLIQLRLIESRSARLDSEATARSYNHHCDVLDTSLSDLQQQLNDARQQMADAAAGSDALHAELRGQIEQLHHELEASEACTEQHRRRCASLEDALKQLQQAMKSGQNKL